MSSETLTHRDLARLLGVSETTVKSYRAKFPTFLPVARAGKPVRLHPEALEVCRRIRQLFDDGLSIVSVASTLKSEFKEYPLNRRLSIAHSPPAGDAVGVPELRQLVETQRQTLEQARQAQDEAARRAEERIAALEAEVRNLATLEAASKALIAELLGELRAARPAPQADPRPAQERQPAPQATAPAPPPAESAADREAGTVLTARRIVTVHGREGAASYSLDREPRPEPPLPEAPRPAQEFLDLPAVVRSERGEFLGLPGGQSIARLVQALVPAGAPAPAWVDETPPQGPAAWTCLLPPDRQRSRELTFELTTTPRGNRVGLVRALRMGQAQASAQEIQELFRQVRDALA